MAGWRLVALEAALRAVADHPFLGHPDSHLRHSDHSWQDKQSNVGAGFKEICNARHDVRYRGDCPVTVFASELGVQLPITNRE
jgi:hypothetical protein